MSDWAKKIVESGPFQWTVLVLVLINAVILGADTLPAVRESEWRNALGAADRVIIYLFILEVAFRIFAHRLEYFRGSWNIFDFLIVLVSLFAATSGWSAIRAFRVLRVLRVVSVIPRMRTVVSALLDAIPGIASVGVVILLIVYVFAVMGANLYGPQHPETFGDVFTAMYTLFQVMTLEGWADIAADVASTHPRSWTYFLTFMLIATFTMLNLFVAIVVRVVEEDSEPTIQQIFAEHKALHAEVVATRRAVEEIRKKLGGSD